jgi:hypothetical protein
VPRYRGTVTQSILDWYAGRAQTAQQWFSNAAAQYWAFTLSNNSADGTRLWVYDAETVSGAAFPAGTGNPSGNPSPIVGYQGSTIGIPSSYALINEAHQTINNAASIVITSPGSIVAGNLLLTYISSQNIAAGTVVPPDSTWILLKGINGTAINAMMTLWAKIAGASEPASYTWTLSGSPSVAIDADFYQFSGNANPGILDTSNIAFSAVSAPSAIAPAVTTTQPGDLIFCVWESPQPAGPFGTLAGFTMGTNFVGYANQWRAGWFIAPSKGTFGPFANSTTNPTTWGALTVALKAATGGAAPAQTPSAPIQNTTPLVPGIVTLNFSLGAIGLAGITRWIPPASHFEWHREAPLAIIDPNVQFNLAGIAPENAAWGSLTWLAIK